MGWMGAVMAASGSTGAYLGMIGVLIVVTVVGGLVVLGVRKRMLEGPRAGGGGEAGLMESLRGMRDRGEITEEEFERTRRVMRERLRNPSEGGVAKATGKAVAKGRGPDNRAG